MKTMKASRIRTAWLTLFAMLVCTVGWGQVTIVKDGVTYTTRSNSSKNATVASCEKTKTGPVVILEKVTDETTKKEYNVTTIAGRAFEKCEGITSVTIPSSITSIEQWAFSECTALESVTLVTGLKTISDYAFISCKSLKTISIPEGIKTIPAQAFRFCEALTTITLPSTLTTIDNAAFVGCKSLKSIDIPQTVTTIGGLAFLDCKTLTTITIPDGVTVIEDLVFKNCTGLTAIDIPTNVTQIGVGAFDGCAGLESISIPAKVEVIGLSAFYLCTGMTAINVDGGNTVYKSVNGVLFNADGTILVVYPGGRKGEYSIPEGVKTICASAFSGCVGITSVTIPASVTEIEAEAMNSHTITKISCLSPKPPKIHDVFKVAEGCVIYVPKGSKAAYEAAQGWKKFTIVEPNTDPNPVANSQLTWKVAIDGLTLTILNAEGQSVEVYSVTGSRIYRVDANASSQIRISVPHTGIYIVRVGETSRKVVVQ